MRILLTTTPWVVLRRRAAIISNLHPNSSATMGSGFTLMANLWRMRGGTIPTKGLRTLALVAVALTLGLPHSCAASAGYLFNQGRFPTDSGPQAIVTGDFNNDGRNDLATANQTGSVSLLIGRPDGTFSAPTNFQVGHFPTFLATADLNRDGYLDLVVVNGYPDKTISVLLGNGDGTFQPQLVFAGGGSPTSVVIADLNADGKLDLAVANFDGTVSILVGFGDGSFTPIASPNAGTSAWAIATADFNRDGKLDLAVTNSASGTISILLGNGNGTFQLPHAFQTGSEPESIAVADLNGDGFLDLAVGNRNELSVSILIGNGDGSFQPQPKIATPEVVEGILVADVNGDGRPDVLAVSSFYSTGIAVLLGNGDGTFQHYVSYIAGVAPFGIVASDFNGDGILDLATASQGDQAVVVLLGNGDGTFSPKTEISGIGFSWAITSGDFNRDGRTDLAIATYSSDGFSGNVEAWLAGANGSLGSPNIYTGPLYGAWAMANADLNNDGNLDLVVLDNYHNAAYVLLGAGDGTFQSYLTVPTASSPSSIAVADVNRDGKKDLIICCSSNTVSVFMGNGDGTFQARQDYAAGLNPVGVSVGDFNLDGAPDISVANIKNSTVSILLSRGDGTFQAPYSVAVGTSPQGVTTGDFNGDGIVDLVSRNYESGTGSILLGNGNGTFKQNTFRTYWGDYNKFIVADVNADGSPDLIASDLEFGRVWVYLNDGVGNFGLPLGYSVGSGSETAGQTIPITAGDFNGDGLVDIAAVKGAGTLTGLTGTLAILMNTPVIASYPSSINFGTVPVGTPKTLSFLLSNPSPVPTIIASIVTAGNFTQINSCDSVIAAKANCTVWATFTPAASGSQTGAVVITDNALAGRQVLNLTGNGAPSQPPQAGSVRPGSGGGASQTFTFSFSDPNGWQSLSVVDILINNVLDGRQACYIAYAVQSNSLILVDDAGDAGGPFAGAMQLNGSGSVSNSQCTINGTGSATVGNGDTLTLTLNISFSSGFAGNKVLYMAARDTGSGNSGWQAMGTWGVPGVAPSGPAVGGMNPARNSALSQTYTFRFTDSNSWMDIGVVDILINSALDGIGACYLAYVPSSATTGSVFLVDDAGDAGGPYAEMVLPGSGTVQNSQCTINGAGSSVTGSGNMLTLNLAITFSSSFVGNRVFYLAARNNTQNSAWQAVGSVGVP